MAWFTRSKQNIEVREKTEDSLPDGIWVGLGSDHTDRKAETIGIALSKQLCAKVLGRTLWRLEEIADRWDRLMLRSFATPRARRDFWAARHTTS